MEPTSLPTAPPAEATAAEADVVGKLSGTRRQFIRGIAAAGASTAVGVDDSISVRRFVKKGLVVAVRVDEPAEVLVQLVAKLPGWKGGKKRLRLVARARGFATKGKQAEIVLRPTPRARVLLWLVHRVKGTLVVTVRDEAGNRTRVTEKVLVGG